MAGEKKKKCKAGMGGGQAAGGEIAAPITDDRFKKMQSDPRFINVPSKKKKVVVDDRFKVCAWRLQTLN